MNTMTTELTIQESDSTQASALAQQSQDAICELTAFELALVGGGASILLD